MLLSIQYQLQIRHHHKPSMFNFNDCHLTCSFCYSHTFIPQSRVKHCFLINRNIIMYVLNIFIYCPAWIWTHVMFLAVSYKACMQTHTVIYRRSPHTSKYTHTHTHTHTHIHTLRVHAHTHTYTYVYVYTHTPIYTYIHIKYYVYVHTHTHTHTYIHTHNTRAHAECNKHTHAT